jgi:hypothetical protein
MFSSREYRRYGFTFLAVRPSTGTIPAHSARGTEPILCIPYPLAGVKTLGRIC